MEAIDVKFCFLFFIILQFNPVVSLQQNKIPVLLWSNSELPSLPSPLEGHTVSTKDFYNGYLQPLIDGPKQNLLVFMQDKLSLEDITRHADVYNEESDGAAFHNLKHYMEKASTHLPGVLSPAEAITTLRESYNGKAHILQSPYSVEELPPLDDGGHLVLVNLPETEYEESARDRTLRQIDGVVGHITSHFEKQKTPYIAMYTARLSSLENAEDSHRSLGRHLLSADETDDPKHTFVNMSGCAWFYARKITLREVYASKDAEKKKTVLPGGVDPTEKNCENNTAWFKIDFGAVYGQVNFSSVILSMYLEHHKTEWKTANLTIDYIHENTNEPTRTAAMLVAHIYAPKKFCYHCTYTQFIKEKNRTKEDESNIEISFEGLQVEQSNSEPIVHKFSNQVNDCVGFFTIPILSALTVLLVLVLILFFGILMIMNINTMDRFDDPKGKSIQVGNVET